MECDTTNVRLDFQFDIEELSQEKQSTDIDQTVVPCSSNELRTESDSRTPTRQLSNNIDDLYDSTLHLATSAVLIKTGTNVCHASQLTLWRSHGEHQVNTESFWVIFTCQVHCHVHACRGSGGVVNFCLSLLSTYWILSTYFLAALEISVCAY